MADLTAELSPLVASDRKTVRKSINLEMCRCLGYLGTLFLLLCGMIITNNFVQYPVVGQGFDPTATFIYELFGFNHTCTVLDFNPSRTISALLVILAVGPLLIYVILNKYRIEHEHINGNVGPKLFKFNMIITPLQLIGFGFFYMVFVNQPLDMQSFILHYIPFQNWQIALVLNEIQQIEYLISRKKRQLPLPLIIEKMPLVLMRAYSCLIVMVFIFYTAFVWSFIAGSPIVDTSSTGGLAFSTFVMYLFLAMSIVIPMISSFLLINSKYGSRVSFEFTTISHRPIASEGVSARPASVSDIQPHSRRRQSEVISFSPSPILVRTTKPNVVRPPLKGMHPAHPIENVVFQGGGAKGIVYCGAIEALDELGILPYLKRFAGASAGCGPALLLALGLDGKQVKKETNELDMNSFFDGGSSVPLWTNLKKGRNLVKRLGIHPANRCLQYFEELLEKYTGDRNLTFLGLYQRFGTELCIAVSNLSRYQSELCHVNTTPELPIKLAIRASMSLPFLWEPLKLDGQLYVDGGVFNNFPIKAFDGWFLSTKPEDNFFARVREDSPGAVQDHSSRSETISAIRETLQKSFTEPNMATIGFRVTDSNTEDNIAYSSHLKRLESELEGGNGLIPNVANSSIQRPPTKLAKRFNPGFVISKPNDPISKYERAFVELNCWMVAIMSKNPSVFHRDIHPHGILSAGFLRMLQESPPGEDFYPELFGLNSWSELVAMIDVSRKGYFTKTDLGRFWGGYGVRNAYMKNRNETSIETLGQLTSEIVKAMFIVSEEALLRDPTNTVRTCTLSSEYVGLLDLKLSDDDKAYLCANGKRDTIIWIKKYSHHLSS